MEDNKELYKGTLIIKERKNIEMDMVESISTFEQTYLEVVTKWGNVTVSGKDMHIIELDKEKGKISVEGEIIEASFEERKGRKKIGGMFG